MEKIKEKLSSRKLWAAILAAVAALAAACFGEELTPEIVSALKCAVTAAIAYIFGEGAVDVARLIAAALGTEAEGKAEPVEEEKDGESLAK